MDEHPLEKVTGAPDSAENGGKEARRSEPIVTEPKVTTPEKGAETLDTEMAQEMTPSWFEEPMRTEDDRIGGQGMGWTGIVLSILAFFIYPVFLGIAGVIFGFFGYRQGAQTLGIWAMVLGGLAVLGALLFSPYFAR